MKTPIFAAALVLASVAGARAEPQKGPCNPWAGTAQVWTVYDQQSGKIKPMTVRECGGIPKGALSYAKRCMAQFGGKLKSQKHVIIGDFSTDANFIRLYVLDWNQGDPEASIPLLRGGLVHGEGNRPKGTTGVPEIALDMMDSAATPGGCMRLFGTGDAGTMQTAGQGLQAYKLDGLEVQNACTWQRGIHFHEGYQQNGVDKIMTRRVEDVGRTDASAPDFGYQDPKAADFDRVQAGRNLGTAATPGCVTLSNDDFAHIKASGIVPPPGPGWKPGVPPRAQEGILFVSWFWGDRDEQAIVSRFTAPSRACSSRTTGVWSEAVPREDGYLKALQENQKRSSRKVESLIDSRWPQ